MQLALSMWSVHRNFFDKNMDVIDFINFADSLSIDGVELLGVFWKDIATELPEVIKLLDERNLKVGAYAVSNDFVQEDSAERAKQVKTVKEGIDIAVQLGTKIVRVFSGNAKKGVTFDKAEKWIIDSLYECADYALKKGITLGLENHGLFAGKGVQVQSIIEKVGLTSLRSTFDAGNFLLVDESPEKAIEILANLTVHVHAKDFKKVDFTGDFVLESIKGEKFLGTRCGEGQVNLEYVIKKLSDINYNNWLSVEFEGTGDEKEGSIQSINYLKELIDY